MGFFPGAMFLLKEAVFINFGIFISFPYSFYFVSFFSLWLCIKKFKFSVIWGGATCIQGAMVIFLPNVPGAMFIQGATSILDSKSMHAVNKQTRPVKLETPQVWLQ